jgi:DNA gyrase subunit A
MRSKRRRQLRIKNGTWFIDQSDDCDLLTVTERGHGKRTPLSEYRVQSRYGKGLIDIKTDERNGHAVATESVDQDDHLFAMSERGQIMRTRVADISTQGRNTMGVIVMRLEEGDSVASVEVLPGGSDGGEDETDAEAGQDADSAGN